MSFFSDASLVMIPSGYKTSKVYSVVPTSGDGDLVFSRSNDTATRVGPDGLIEKVRTNLLTYSEALDNAAWTKSGVGTFTSAITTGFTDPTGGTDAQRWLATIASVSDRAFVRQLATLTNGIPYSVSFWVKSNTASSQDIYFMFQGGAAQATTATTSWQRISYSATTSTTSVLVGIEAKDLATDVLIYGFQLESGDIMTDYIPTTTAAVSVGPVANVPRLDYLNSSCPRLLLEPQRTNLVTYSEQLNNAAWVIGQSGTGVAPVVTANNAISPDGTQNADTVVFNSGAGTTASDFSTLFQTFGGTTATYTGSFYAKTASGTAQIQVRIDGNNYDKFTITNQWQRFTLTKALTGTSNVFEMVIRRGLNEPMNASATIQLWGVQVELGAYATSYIPTLGAAVTRGADAASKTGISSLIGQTEGTLFTDFVVNGLQNFGTPISVNDGSTNNYVWLTIFGNGTLRAEVFNTSGVQATLSYSGAVVGGRYKMAFAYKANDFVLYVNGALIQSSNSGSTFSGSTLSRVDFDITNPSSFSVASESINQALVFKTRLTNAALAELTA